jgi:hypothetical protein
LDGGPNVITEAQQHLIIRLVRIVESEPDERKRRWPRNSELALRYAEQGQLLLAREWTADLVLDDSGRVIVVDTEDGNPQTPATERETRLALFTAIEVMPELLSFLPQRPPDAVTCPSCEGTGVVEMALENPNLRNLRCACFGAGWQLPSELAPSN